MKENEAAVKSLGFRSYSEYLESPLWLAKKEQYEKSGRSTSCRLCPSRETVLHHVTYSRLGCEILDDLMPLCKRDHLAVHAWLYRERLSVESTDLAIQALNRGDYVSADDVSSFLAAVRKGGASFVGKVRGRGVVSPEEIKSVMNNIFQIHQILPKDHPFRRFNQPWRKNMKPKVKLKVVNEYLKDLLEAVRHLPPEVIAAGLRGKSKSIVSLVRQELASSAKDMFSVRHEEAKAKSDYFLMLHRNKMKELEESAARRKRTI